MSGPKMPNRIIQSFPQANNGIFGSELLDGVLYIVGNFSTVGGMARNGLAAIDVATQAVLPFNPLTAQADLRCIKIVGGVIYLGGQGTITAAAGSRNNAAAMDLSGMLLP